MSTSPEQFGARNFLERIGILTAYRNPEPRIVPADFKVHRLPLEAPLPLSDLQGYLNGDPPPDRGQTLEWPHPSERSI